MGTGPSASAADRDFRSVALDVLQELTEEDDERAVSSVCARIEHADSRVRSLAVDALREIAEKGNERAIAALCARFTDGDHGIRCKAVDALREVAEKGDERAISGVCACLQHADSYVRTVAVDALRDVAEKGNERAISALCARLKDRDGGVRLTAVDALKEVAEKGNKLAIAALCAHLDDSYSGVRLGAVGGLKEEAEKGDECVMSAVSIHLQQAVDALWHWTLAVDALREVAEKGDERAIAVLCTRLKDPDRGIRLKAVAALREVSEKSDKRAISAVCIRLEDADSRVRSVAVDALVAEQGNQLAIAALCAHVADGYNRIQWKAVTALKEVTGMGDPMSAFGVCLQHADSDVRALAVSALGEIVEKGSERAISAVCARLQDTDPGVRLMAVAALKDVAEKGDEYAISSVCACLQHADSDVRALAVAALREVAEKGDEHAISAVCACLQHEDSDVRIVALDALRVVAEKGNKRAIASLFVSCSDDCALRDDDDGDSKVRKKTVDILKEVADCDISEQVSMGTAIAALESNTALAMCISKCDLASTIHRFAQALRVNNSVRFLDLSFMQITKDDAVPLATALTANITLIGLRAPASLRCLSDWNGQVVTALSRNRAGARVLTLSAIQVDSGDKLRIICTDTAGKLVAEVELMQSDTFLTLDTQIAQQSPHPGFRLFVNSDGNLLDRMPDRKVYELLEWPASAKLPDQEVSESVARGAPISDLGKFLLASHDGNNFEPPLGYVAGHGILLHEETGITLLCPPLQVGQVSPDMVVLYHYTKEQVFNLIVSNTWTARHLHVSSDDGAHFGDGIYTSRKSPDEFGTKDAVLRNNYTNKVDEEGQERQILFWRDNGFADFCIPLCVPRSYAVNVQHERTKEMQEAGMTVHEPQRIRPDRDIWVVVIPDEEGRGSSASVLRGLAAT